MTRGIKKAAKAGAFVISVLIISVLILTYFFGFPLLKPKHQNNAKRVKQSPEQAKNRRSCVVRISIIPQNVAVRSTGHKQASRPVRTAEKPHWLSEGRGVSRNKKKQHRTHGIATIRLDEKTKKRGLRLLRQIERPPVVYGDYSAIGFELYLDRMIRMGGRIFVGDPFEEQILGEAVLVRGPSGYMCAEIRPVEKKDLCGLALFRPRQLTGEPLCEEIIQLARQSFETDDLVCVLLLPIDEEAAILGAMDEHVSGLGYRISEFDAMWGSYFYRRGMFGLFIHTARVRKSHKVLSIKLRLCYPE